MKKPPSEGLRELLAFLRDHPCFTEFMAQIEAPTVKSFRQSEPTDKQTADWIFQSGRRLQHESWRQFLIGPEASQQEKS